MLKRRGSFKVAPGVRVNYGKRGFTSVNVAGVNLGSSRSRGKRRGPTKAQLLEQHWRTRPGIYYVRIEVDRDNDINLVVDGGELTYRRMMRMADALEDRNAEAVARAAKSFIREWDILEEEGGKPLPITKRTVELLGIELVFGVAVEVANALGIPKKPLGHVMTISQTGKPPLTTVSTSPTQPSLREQVPAPEAVDRQQSQNSDKTRLSGLKWFLIVALVLIVILAVI